MDKAETWIDLASDVMKRSLARGADVAEVIIKEGRHLSVTSRLMAPELLEEAGTKGIGLRVIQKHRVATTHTSDFSRQGIERLIGDAVELCALSQEDAFSGPPDPSELMKEAPADLSLYDARVPEIDAERAWQLAFETEQAAFDVDPRITQSEGSSFSRAEGQTVLVTSGGFVGTGTGTLASISVSTVADDVEGKKRNGSYWSSNRFAESLESASFVGQEAARRTLGKLGARKIPTQQAPVIFDPDVSRSILGLIAGCVSGGAIWRKSSYLVGREGTPVASTLVHVVDDPLIPKAPGSRPFDGEGLASRKNIVIHEGILKTYLLDTYSGKKLGRKSTASASRGLGGNPGVSTTNFIMRPGSQTPEDLLKETPRGLYVTEMMGFGFNAVTGDFSRGASGYWIENGEKVFPVSEVTISLNLNDLLLRIDGIANDLNLKTSIAAPTFRVSSMMIAGSS